MLTASASDADSVGLEITIVCSRMQGRDWPCVLVSMVRSNKERDAGPLLAELRRVNVALTRAKSKLILIGAHARVSKVYPSHPVGKKRAIHATWMASIC